jgi:uncharacterized protein (DUF1501 family)
LKEPPRRWSTAPLLARSTSPQSARAAASTAADYKALVCIFLFGGNDCTPAARSAITDLVPHSRRCYQPSLASTFLV